jgi:predicted  nucleic acid-binding Zn-ribbon protein
MANEPENLVLELLRGIRGDMAAFKTDVARKFGQLDAKIDRLDRKVDSVIKQQIDMQHDVSMLRHAIVPGEMEAANRDLGQLRREVDELTVRLEAIEERQKDH